MTFLHGFLICMALAAVLAFLLTFAACLCAVSGSATRAEETARGRRG